jgi:replicative DNA helicase
MNHDQKRTGEAIYAEQSVIGALLIDNDALDRIADLTAMHFYRHEHQTIFAEFCRQAAAGKRVDVISLFDALRDKVADCLPYLNELAQSVGSAVNVGKYADIVIDRATKRSIAAMGGEMQDMLTSNEPADQLVDRVTTRLEALGQKKTRQEPERMSDMLGNYIAVIESRMAGEIRPISTGFVDLDKRLDGGLERGTLTVVAGRPGMGKTAMGLCLARNAAEWGTSLFLSMEMARDQVNDRNIAALGKLPISWLRSPSDKGPDGEAMFAAMTHAFTRATELNLYIDDQTALNMLEIRNKCRSVKRRKGLDMIVIDQLSFITGSSQEKSWDAIGEYTRGMLALAKELNVAVVLLCQLNRKCEERQNKRPILSDLAASGSIEQDASTVIFLYRDEIYNADSKDKGVCEVITAKQRQGQPGTVGMAYIGPQTRFEDLAHRWEPNMREPAPARRGFD